MFQDILGKGEIYLGAWCLSLGEALIGLEAPFKKYCLSVTVTGTFPSYLCHDWVTLIWVVLVSIMNTFSFELQLILTINQETSLKKTKKTVNDSVNSPQNVCP